jgi:hypothetical protein
MDFNGILGRPRPDEIPVLDRGNYTAYAHHIQGPDAPIIAPQNITFTCQLDTQINKHNLRRAMCNPDRDTPWLVGSVTFSNVNGSTQLRNGAGSLVSTAVPYDTQHDRIKLAVLWKGDPAQAGTDDMGWNFNEVWFAPHQVRVVEAPDSLKLAATGWCYGPVSAITLFDAGTDVSR